jgi:hypothetical protein
MKKHTLLLAFFALCNSALVMAQNVGVNATGATPDNSAMLDIAANNKGLLMPRVSLSSTTDGTTIPGPATSLLVYNTNGAITGGDGVGFYYNAGTPLSPNWLKLITTAAAPTSDHDWYRTGTTLAPTDIADSIYTLGNVAIGKTSTDFRLEIEHDQGERGVSVLTTHGGDPFLTSYYAFIDNTEENPTTGLEIYNDGSGNNQRQGVYVNLGSDGNGPRFGSIVYMDNNGDNEKTAYRAEIYGDGDALMTGYQVDLYNDGDADHYGFRADLGGTGAGVHYGVYANVSQPTGFAGYFLGNVSIGSTTANNYILPPSRGANGQVMVTDGSGMVSWQNPGNSGGNFWELTGNTGTNPATNFVGTTDAQPLVFRTRNQHSGVIDSLTASTALGFRALSNYSTGINNTAMGFEALFSNTSAGNNVAIGSSSLRSNTTGVNNAALGAFSLNSNTTGSFNTAIGTYAMSLNTTGYSNVAVGDAALRSNTTGYSNVAVGLNALNSNISGHANTGLILQEKGMLLLELMPCIAAPQHRLIQQLAQPLCMKILLDSVIPPSVGQACTIILQEGITLPVVTEPLVAIPRGQITLHLDQKHF